MRCDVGILKFHCKESLNNLRVVKTLECVVEGIYIHYS